MYSCCSVSNNRKFNNMKQRWQILTSSAGIQSQNKENQANQNALTVQASTKKIKKVPPITQLLMKKPQQTRTITQYFKLTRKLENIRLKDNKGQIHEFICHDDRLLNIPAQFNQTIPHSIDNDCETDSEQINSAITQLKGFLEQATKQQLNISID